MKIYVYVCLLAMLFLSACEEDFERVTVNSTLVVTFSDYFNNIPANGARVVLKNNQKNTKIEGITDEIGTLTFSNLDPGFYNVSVLVKLSSEQVKSLSDLIITDSLVFNGNYNLELLSNNTDSVVLSPAFKSNLVIREFYYSGSLLSTGNNYLADQYIEIFNNSSETQTIAGLIIAEHESYGNGFNPWSYIKDSVVVKSIWQIPENTSNNKLEPGKSIVIARDAINHKDDENGNPLSPVNLANSDFEFYVEGTENKDLDSQAENLIEIFSTYAASDYTFHSRNGGGILLLDPQDNNINTYILNHRIKKYNVTGSSFKYVIALPNVWVLDAIDVLKDKNSEAFKRFPNDLDAGFTHNSASGSGTCISRRLVSDVDGVKRYMDTNNSSVDFLINQIPNPFLNE